MTKTERFWDSIKATPFIPLDKGAISNLYPATPVETRPALSLQVQVRFYENVKGIAPGQSAVFYEGDDVIGGGIIQRGMLNA